MCNAHARGFLFFCKKCVLFTVYAVLYIIVRSRGFDLNQIAVPDDKTVNVVAPRTDFSDGIEHSRTAACKSECNPRPQVTPLLHGRNCRRPRARRRGRPARSLLILNRCFGDPVVFGGLRRFFRCACGFFCFAYIQRKGIDDAVPPLRRFLRICEIISDKLPYEGAHRKLFLCGELFQFLVGSRRKTHSEINHVFLLAHKQYLRKTKK